MRSVSQSSVAPVRLSRLSRFSRLSSPLLGSASRILSRCKPAIIMTPMLAIRYVTLAALVVWLGGMVTLALLTVPSVEDLRRFQWVGYACGAIIFVCLFIIKFIGPPPHDV